MSFLESIIYMAWRGLAIGIIISAPMGPVGMLIIQRTLDKGRRAGLYMGFGAAISDIFYSLLTGLGLSFIEEFLERNHNVIQIAGSIVLIAFGVYLFKRNPSKGLKKPEEEIISKKKSILGGFLFTFSNPLIIFLIIGLFARFNFLMPGFSVPQYFTGYIFIFIGALIWWWFITFSIDKVSHHFNIRSMWLINRIIGAIILIFAIVGIVTAATSLASAQETRCWNSKRGLGPFENLRNASGGDTLHVLTATGDADGVEFRCKVRNRRPSDLKKGWGFLLKGTDGDEIAIDIRSVEGEFDGISSQPALEVTIRGAEADEATQTFKDHTDLLRKVKKGMSGPDPTGSLNFYKLSLLYGHLTLFGGLHSPERLMEARLPDSFRIDSIGFYLAPGAELEARELRLSLTDLHNGETADVNPEGLEEYFKYSHDLMEGYWQILDRSLDEDLLRQGGDYRLAIVKNGRDYDIIYLSGAKVNSDTWEPGMLKGKLSPSGIAGVWNAVWYDAMHQPLHNEIKAQRDETSGVLTIQFPYQDSRLRLFPATPAAGSDR